MLPLAKTALGVLTCLWCNVLIPRLSVPAWTLPTIRGSQFSFSQICLEYSSGIVYPSPLNIPIFLARVVTWPFRRVCRRIQAKQKVCPVNVVVALNWALHQSLSSHGTCTTACLPLPSLALSVCHPLLAPARRRRARLRMRGVRSGKPPRPPQWVPPTSSAMAMYPSQHPAAIPFKSSE